jgi:hypothetical protein
MDFFGGWMFSLFSAYSRLESYEHATSPPAIQIQIQIQILYCHNFIIGLTKRCIKTDFKGEIRRLV